jgi:REP element-mobilizing transposase RayT
MAASRRANTGHSCYFITASSFQKQNLFQSDRMARLFVEVLLYYRMQEKYLLHEFVAMPNHFHLLTTPQESLERSLQLIKGGFSYRARKDLRFIGESGSRATTTGAFATWRSTALFASTFTETRRRAGWLGILRTIPAVQLIWGSRWTAYLSG